MTVHFGQKTEPAKIILVQGRAQDFSWGRQDRRPVIRGHVKLGGSRSPDEDGVGANPVPIPHPTNLALFGHKITLYRFN